MVVVSVVVMSVTMIVLSIVAVFVFMRMIVFAIAAVFTTMVVLSIVPAALVIRLVFRGSYEVHRPIARIILAAMPAPIPSMPRRHV
jgi:hypothetical protein